jgi:hypothetical protein
MNICTKKTYLGMRSSGSTGEKNTMPYSSGLANYIYIYVDPCLPVNIIGAALNTFRGGEG